MDMEPHEPPQHDEMHRDALLQLFAHHSIKEKVQRVLTGLKQPKDSGEYKYAKFQMLRLASPISALLVPILGVGLLALLAHMTPERERLIEVQVMEPEAIEDLDEIEDLMDEPLEPPEPIDLDFASPDFTMTEDIAAPANQEVSAQPANFDAVMMVKSPVIMKGIYGSRSPGRRGAAMREFGGSGVTEGAVLRALRWLKKNQNSDGSWPKTKPAMTAMALLTFLAHGETTSSEEFGETVQKAIRWLVDNQSSGGGWPRRYQHAICTYAICEAFALTKIPMLKDAAEKGIDIVIKGQNATGGWGYAFPDKFDDTSCMGWCAQALKAGKMAGIKHPQLNEAIKLAVKGFQKNAHPEGGFGYRAPGKGGLSSAGVLCMQLLGAGKELECKKGLAYLEPWTYNWQKPHGKSPVYYWYYATQAKFHAGGTTWDKWNRMFAIELVKNQTVEKDAIEGPAGELVDIGFWDSPAEHEHSDGRVMDTCLSALQLQVYYRYLPTFKTPTLEDEEVDLVSDEGDIEVEISI